MKLPVLLLTGSLVANATLLAVYLRRPSTAGDSSRHSSAASAPADASKTEPSAAKSTLASTPPTAAGINPKAWSSLESADLKTLALRLRAAGFPPSVVNAVIRAQITELQRPRIQALLAGIEEKPFWKTDRDINAIVNPLGDPKIRTAFNELNRESNELFKAALGLPEISAEAAASPFYQRRYGAISPEKFDQLQRVETDYNELRQDVNNAARGLMLPEDREKLALLEKEKRADLAKILTPDELNDYLIRSSNTTSRLRMALTAMNATEEEFRAIYQAQVAFDEKYTLTTGSIPADFIRDRQAAQSQVSDQIKLALGDQRFAEYTRSSDREFQTLIRLTQSASLPAASAIQAYDLRDTTSKESNRIFSDTTLTNDQKRAALKTLAATTRSQLSTTLGDSAARSYLETATWITRMENGAAVTFNPGGGTSIRNVPVTRSPGTPTSSAPTAPSTPTVIGNGTVIIR